MARRGEREGKPPSRHDGGAYPFRESIERHRAASHSTKATGSRILASDEPTRVGYEGSWPDRLHSFAGYEGSWPDRLHSFAGHEGSWPNRLPFFAGHEGLVDASLAPSSRVTRARGRISMPSCAGYEGS